MNLYSNRTDSFKKNKIEFSSCARGVSGVANLINIDKQLQQNRCCYFLHVSLASLDRVWAHRVRAPPPNDLGLVIFYAPNAKCINCSRLLRAQCKL